MKRYEGKNVVIIGGTSGMGLATAKTTACWQTRIRLTGCASRNGPL
jgi:NAD(P)-dependent dehydrogenase (short-subunit alcohol dehydrogenase family)